MELLYVIFWLLLDIAISAGLMFIIVVTVGALAVWIKLLYEAFKE